MQITELSRTYSRSISFKKPDGTEMWIRHEMTAKAQVDSHDELKATGEGLEELVRKEVGASIKAEKAKIEKSFEPKAEETDEPFPGEMPGARKNPAKMPRL